MEKRSVRALKSRSYAYVRPDPDINFVYAETAIYLGDRAGGGGEKMSGITLQLPITIGKG